MPIEVKCPTVREQYEAFNRYRPKDCLLGITMGDFVEFLGDDAPTVSEALGIVLTYRRDGVGGRLPMCAIPTSCLPRYLNRLEDQGHQVAILSRAETSEGRVIA